MRKRFCPKCGATEKPFVKGFCRDCFLESHKLVVFPVKLELRQCRDCGKILLEGKWLLFSVERMLDWIKGKIKTNELDSVRVSFAPVLQPQGHFVVLGTVLGELAGEFVELPFETQIRLNPSLCSDCSKLSADYYEAVLQLRLDGLPKNKWASVLKLAEESVKELHQKDSLARITNIRALKNGFDVFIGSKRAGKLVSEKINHAFGGEIVRSFSLVGVDKSGKTKKRFTFLVRV